MELLFVNGVMQDSEQSPMVNFDDRGLHYGDGVFETLRIFEGNIPMWEFHLQRLKAAEKTLKLALQPFLNQWPIFVRENLATIENACAKLVITRGVGPRGYKIPDHSQLQWWLKITDLPEASSSQQVSPKTLTLCQHPISRQPRLAGLKHLNRLDQVLARSEFSGFDEGIMFNLDGDVIEGTMSNIFWLKNGQLNTPDLSQEGIDGCVRRWVISQQKEIKETVNIVEKAKLDQLLTADGVFICNSLMGIQPVVEIDGQKINQADSISILAKQFNQQFTG
jgi:4-amino-4-deoxychorismate lyase